MHDIVNEEGPLVPESLRAGFRTALTQLDESDAFGEVTNALRTDEDGAGVEQLEADLNRVGLLGQSLELKLEVVDWSFARANGAWDLARRAGPPEGPDLDDDPSFNAADPREDPDPQRRVLWRRARKLLTKLLGTIDDFFESLISAIPIPGVGEAIGEIKKALESVLDR
ncbi:hypothetical protein OOK12_32605 [Streptomyces sp. NBC_00452]|uniref:hypothetical protein n=1 Tax=Streptomyces sp. NBC_00452 TaxID=2975746 RepID=UPI00224F8DFA|nr:hypothetical protein [Streptomyces sp. NBC_00452]MCX5061698.1 hypothetical protein [Streptomyces sp. NBC_00452]